MTSIARLEDVSVKLGGHPVLEGVSVDVADGEIVTLVGPNGAGKTTLLRVLLGLQAPDAGTAALRPGTRVGYLPQRLVIDDTLPLTVRRFLALGRSHAKTEIAQALSEVGIPDAAGTPVQGLSGGELQRVLLARALLRDPDLLVLDEPVQGVDVSGQGELYALIRRIRDRRRCGVLLVSHDLHLVMAASDKVVCLNRHVCCSGEPEAVTRHPAYRALFGDAIAVYAHHHDHAHAVHGEPVPALRDGTDG